MGFTFEVMSDSYLNWWKTKPENKGRICTTGPWKISRFPNYFGEISEDPHTLIKRFKRDQKAIIDMDWKYLWSSDGRRELYQLSRDPAEMDDLDRGEGLDVQGWASGADAAQHLKVIIELQPRVKAADDVHLGRAGVGGFLSGCDHLLDGHLVRALFAALAVEAAELA